MPVLLVAAGSAVMYGFLGIRIEELGDSATLERIDMTPGQLARLLA